MRAPELRLFADEIIVDNFAGGGGASLGIEMGLGRSPDIAINHDPEAIAMHKANHPLTNHYCEDVWKVDPVRACKGRAVGLAWFSPDCKHFSKAKGGKPVEKKIRGLAWIVVRWAKAVKPRVIILENVEEFAEWGPLGSDGKPCPLRKGFTFRRWLGQLRNLGYEIDFRELVAADYGTPTTRNRLYLIARRDGKAIVWPEATHSEGGHGRRLVWRSAAECIDFLIPTYSIFLTKQEGRAFGVKRPLVDNTMARIARGMQKFVIDADDPFLVPLTHSGPPRANSIREPFRTVTGAHRGETALVAPYLVPRYGERDGQQPRALSVEGPMPTIVPTQNGGQLVAAFMAQHNTGEVGHRMKRPVSTIVQKGCTQALVTSNLIKLKGTCRHGQNIRKPIHTIQAGGNHFGEVRAFLMKYHTTGGQLNGLRGPMPTVMATDSIGLVTVHGEQYYVADIGMRMLAPRELYRAQGFPDSYLIAPVVDGKPLTKDAQVRMVGNSVCPPMAMALARAQFEERAIEVVA